MDGQAGGRPGRYTACRTDRRCGAVPDVRRRTDCAMNDKKFVICRVFRIFASMLKRENEKVRKRPVIRPAAGRMRREPGAGQAPRSPGSAERIHICRTECTPPPDDQLHAGAAIRRRHAVGRHRPARRIGRSDASTSRPGAPRCSHACRRRISAKGSPCSTASSTSSRGNRTTRLYLRLENGQENPRLPLSGRRLGTHHRREKLYMSDGTATIYTVDPATFRREKRTTVTLQRQRRSIPQRAGVDRRQDVGQRLHHRPDRHHRPRDGRRRRGRRPRGTAARRGDDRPRPTY